MITKRCVVCGDAFNTTKWRIDKCGGIIIMVYDKVWSFPFSTPLRPNSNLPTPLNMHKSSGEHKENNYINVTEV